MLRVQWASIKYASVLRAMLQVRKAHEVTFTVSMLEIHTLFKNINSLHETSRKILLRTASNQRVFELIVDVDKASKVIDRCWVINEQEGIVILDHSDYRFY